MVTTGCSAAGGIADPPPPVEKNTVESVRTESSDASKLDSSLQPLPVDSERARAYGNGSRKEALALPDATTTNVYVVCRGTTESKTRALTIIQENDELLSATCDEIPERFQIIGPSAGAIDIVSEKDIIWSIVIAQPRN